MHQSEREQYRAAVRSFLASRTDPAPPDEPYLPANRALWRMLCDELGVGGLGVAEADGGQGGDVTDRSVALAELGRAAVRTPHLPVIVATDLLCAPGLATTSPVHVLRRRLVAGELIATVSFDFGTDAPPVRSARSSDELVLDGRLRWVPHAPEADVLLVLVGGEPEPSLALVDLHTPGVHVAGVSTVDITRTIGEVELRGAVGLVLGQAPGLARAARASAITAVASEQVGGARRMLDSAVEHAQSRTQFGRPIGGFQAVQHLCADMLAQVEAADVAADAAAAALTAWRRHEISDVALDSACHLAGAVCGDAYVSVAATAIQVHGGLGYTWEHHAHVHFRRAWLNSLIVGSPAEHRAALLAADLAELVDARA